MKSIQAPRSSETEETLRNLADSIASLATMVGMKFTVDNDKIRHFSRQAGDKEEGQRTENRNSDLQRLG